MKKVATFIVAFTLLPALTFAATPTILDTIPAAGLTHTYSADTASDSFTYTVPGGGTNDCLIVLSSNGFGTWASTVTAMSQNGTDFHTQFSSLEGGRLSSSAVFWLANPTTGTFTWSAPHSIGYLTIFTVKDCAQTSPVDLYNTSSSFDFAITTFGTSTVGNDLVLAPAMHAGAAATVSSYGFRQAEVSTASGPNNWRYTVSWEAGASAAQAESATTTFSTSQGNDGFIALIKYLAPTVAATPFIGATFPSIWIY